MNIYTVYVKNGRRENLENAFFVKEGFSFFAAIFQAFWALYNKMWLCAAALVLVNVFIASLFEGGIMNAQVSAIIKISLFAFVGFSANDWYRYYLDKKGFRLFEVVSGKDVIDAKRRFFSSYLKDGE